jgi:hypothetical protein
MPTLIAIASTKSPTDRHTDRMLVIAVVLDRTPFQYA